MKTREHAAAVLSDLEAELARPHRTYDRLHKLATLSGAALWLRQQVEPDAHDWLTDELRRIALALELAEACLWARDHQDADDPGPEQIVMPDRAAPSAPSDPPDLAMPAAEADPDQAPHAV